MNAILAKFIVELSDFDHRLRFIGGIGVATRASYVTGTAANQQVAGRVNLAGVRLGREQRYDGKKQQGHGRCGEYFRSGRQNRLPAQSSRYGQKKTGQLQAQIE